MMDNYICIGGQKIELAVELIDKVRSLMGSAPKRKLANLEPGEAFKIGNHELVVLEHSVGETAVIYKGLLHERMKFGSSNDFDGSDVSVVCEDFAGEIAEIIGAENLVEHTVDLTSDDGLDDYGTTDCFVSLLTLDFYRAKAYLRYCLEVITAYLETLELTLNGKTQIFPFKSGVSYLGFHTYIAANGTSVRRLKNQNKRNAQKKFVRMAKLVASGKLTRAKFDASYNAWKNHASHGNCYGLIRTLDEKINKILEEAC